MASSKPDLCARTLDRLRALSVTSEDALLVAVSGGMDSMSLLSVLCMLRDDSEVGSLAAVHVNHLLRGEASENDELLVRKQCEEHRVPLEVRRMDALSYARGRKLGIEEAARECRYQAFEECAKELAIRYVLTAHTANDQVETILMNIVRGAGLRGIAGIPASRQSGDVTILRPWLSVTRDEIEAYQSDVNIAYSTDATNAELTFQRNRVRHIVVPALQQAFPDRDVLRAFAMLAERAAGLSQTVQWVAEQELAKALSGGPGLELSTL
jgi:tRNA(Ile)-lysidine synthase